MVWPRISQVIVTLAILLVGGFAQAQQTEQANARTADEALRNKAVNLLKSLSSQIGSLQSPENRARLGSNIAASLWNHDEARARSLLASVEADIRTGLQTVDEDPQANALAQIVFLKLRMDTVERIAKHDPELALAFLKATEMDANEPRHDEVGEMERAMETRLARLIAAESPEMALRLGRRSLVYGFSDDLRLLLKKLYQKDKERGLALYKEIVAKLREVGLGTYSPQFSFARNLANSLQPPLADEATFRELIDLFISTAIKNGCGGSLDEEDQRVFFCREIGSLLPIMEKIDPVRTANLKHLQGQRHWYSSPEGYDEFRELAESGAIDEMLALADKYPHLKHQIYWQAVVMAEASGDIERARKIASDFSEDPETSKLMLKRVDRYQAWDSKNTGNLAEAQKRLAEIPRVHERVWFLLTLANQVGTNDRKAALKLLDQANEMVNTMKPGKQQAEAEVALAMMYCLEKSDRGLTMMESVLPKLNELVAAAAKLEGYDSRNIRDGEWNMSNQGSIGSLLTFLSQNAASFAWCDFDRALTLTDQFERTEIRLMAQLKLAQAILAGPPKRALPPRAFQYWEY